MSEPVKHHYLPEFYLSRWRNEAGLLVEFCTRYGKLYARPTSTKGTGYRPHLYSLQLSDDPQQLEKGFMKKLDTRASKVLDLLEAGTDPDSLTVSQRSDWSRFLMSLLMRTPSDIETFKTAYAAEWVHTTPAQEETYRAKRQPGWPETLSEALQAQGPLKTADDAMETAARMMDHDGLGKIINNMIWAVIDTSEASGRFLTSDRPVMFDMPFLQRDSYLFLPIGPTKIFAATHNAQTMARVFALPLESRVEASNQFVSGHAVSMVYGQDASARDFVAQHISKRPQPSLAELLARQARARTQPPA